MHVMIESIDQRLLLDGGDEPVTTINIKLPDGSYLSAQIEASGAKRILQLANPDSPKVVSSPPPPTASAQEEVYGGEDQQATGANPDETIDWTVLPDSDLTPQMKGILAEIGVPHQMMVQASGTPVGQVQRLQPVRARTVPKDELGYPMVSRSAERDPGEMGPGVDEDGVSQT